LSADSNNTVIGFVRNKKATEEKIQRELPGRSNIHTIQGEIQNLESVKVCDHPVSSQDITLRQGAELGE
jgi:hypothetical protein